MQIHSIPVIVAAGICLYVGLYYLFLYIAAEKEHIYIFFSMACFSVALYNFTCFGLYNAADITAGMLWQIGNFTGIALFGTFMFWFVTFYIERSAESRIKKITWAITTFYIIIVLIIIFYRSELTLSVSKPAVKHIQLGDTISYVYNEVEPGIIPVIEMVVGLFSFSYFLILMIKYYLKNKRVETLTIIISLSIFYVTLIADTFVATGHCNFIYTGEYAFLLIIMTMSYVMLKRYTRLNKENREANYKLMQNRMKPHFLFNALNSINGYMFEDVNTAHEALIQLSKTYYFLLVNSDQSIVSFKDEWEFIKNYLEIEQLRFRNRFVVTMNMDGNFSDVFIPPLMLQPLVENVFKHAFNDIEYIGEINIHALREKDVIKISVVDNGVGLSKDDIFGRSLGNIINRLRYYYKDAQLIAENRTPPNKGVIVQILFNVGSKRYRL